MVAFTYLINGIITYTFNYYLNYLHNTPQTPIIIYIRLSSGKINLCILCGSANFPDAYNIFFESVRSSIFNRYLVMFVQCAKKAACVAKQTPPRNINKTII